jgi:hypothetical protein
MLVMLSHRHGVCDAGMIAEPTWRASRALPSLTRALAHTVIVLICHVPRPRAMGKAFVYILKMLGHPMSSPTIHVCRFAFGGSRFGAPTSISAGAAPSARWSCMTQPAWPAERRKEQKTFGRFDTLSASAQTDVKRRHAQATA